MTAYLYTWNPKRWFWSDQADAIYRINNNEEYDTYWSCGNTKKINIGGIFFLMKLGEDPKGIIGFGYVTSKPYELTHWDEDKANDGKLALRTDLLFKVLSDTPIISIDYLIKNYPEYKWTPQSGGMTISDSIEKELLNDLQANLSFNIPTISSSEITIYVEGKSKTITSKSYDRSVSARQACIEYYGYSCTVCGFNFQDNYGELGKTYIEVHHLKQIADIGEEYEINPIEDLRPICANCHRMLHRVRPPLSIEELKINIKI